jgi:hypothetical protein
VFNKLHFAHQGSIFKPNPLYLTLGIPKSIIAA